uniref:Uncharacterized protein n=1 Tax=Lepeophtheirus salmonis TaxID=72036 RepID=A0A0K2V9U0_LEPSM
MKQQKTTEGQLDIKFAGIRYLSPIFLLFSYLIIQKPNLL